MSSLSPLCTIRFNRTSDSGRLKLLLMKVTMFRRLAIAMNSSTRSLSSGSPQLKKSIRNT